jgi:hypothetical protein
VCTSIEKCNAPCPDIRAIVKPAGHCRTGSTGALAGAGHWLAG